MRTHDAFLRYLLGAVDRALVWAVLAIVLSALTWTSAWERGLGLRALDGWRVLGFALLGHETDRTVLTLLVLCVLVGVMGATLVGGWLFRRWRRRAELDVLRVRGTRWEDDRRDERPGRASAPAEQHGRTKNKYPADIGS
jgi:hypothetical protein